MKIERKSNYEIFSPNGGDDMDGISYRIIACVAELKDASPMELPPLTDSIDPEALDTLVESATTQRCSIVFPFAGTQVNVNGDGDVYVFIPKFSGTGSQN
ncbi:HalOD1 output domain-containing protein [Haloferax sp. DFSO60]|uniref:HalOD1 output domain-containing protein n=1 Tax=Haloferax sp. DFSO60 TaxID=3388652 RepID=UPI0039795EBE